MGTNELVLCTLRKKRRIFLFLFFKLKNVYATFVIVCLFFSARLTSITSVRQKAWKHLSLKNPCLL